MQWCAIRCLPKPIILMTTHNMLKKLRLASLYEYPLEWMCSIFQHRALFHLIVAGRYPRVRILLKVNKKLFRNS